MISFCLQFLSFLLLFYRILNRTDLKYLLNLSHDTKIISFYQRQETKTAQAI